MKKVNLYLVRHGETKWSLSGQHTGTTDIALTENGEKGAKLFEPFFKDKEFALVLTSPLQRAKNTCTLAGLGKQAEVEPNLIEWNYGKYEGLTSKEIREKSPSWEIFKDGCPKGEGPEQMSARADLVIAKARAADGDVIFFAHGHILKVIAARWLDLPITEGAHFMLDTATLSILSSYQNIPAIKLWNVPSNLLMT